MTVGNQQCYIQLPAYHGSRLIDRPVRLPSEQEFRRVRRKKVQELPSSLIISDELTYVWCKNDEIVIDEVRYDCPDFPFSVRRNHQVDLRPLAHRSTPEKYRSQGVIDYPLRATEFDSSLATIKPPDLKDLPIKEPKESPSNLSESLGTFLERAWAKIKETVEGSASLFGTLFLVIAGVIGVY